MIHVYLTKNVPLQYITIYTPLTLEDEGTMFQRNVGNYVTQRHSIMSQKQSCENVKSSAIKIVL